MFHVKRMGFLFLSHSVISINFGFLLLFRIYSWILFVFFSLLPSFFEWIFYCLLFICFCFFSPECKPIFFVVVVVVVVNLFICHFIGFNTCLHIECMYVKCDSRYLLFGFFLLYSLLNILFLFFLFFFFLSMVNEGNQIAFIYDGFILVISIELNNAVLLLCSPKIRCPPHTHISCIFFSLYLNVCSSPLNALNCISIRPFFFRFFFIFKTKQRFWLSFRCCFR